VKQSASSAALVRVARLLLPAPTASWSCRTTQRPPRTRGRRRQTHSRPRPRPIRVTWRMMNSRRLRRSCPRQTPRRGLRRLFSSKIPFLILEGRTEGRKGGRKEPQKNSTFDNNTFVHKIAKLTNTIEGNCQFISQVEADAKQAEGGLDRPRDAHLQLGVRQRGRPGRRGQDRVSSARKSHLHRVTRWPNCPVPLPLF
jgi:hypothetical protein